MAAATTKGGGGGGDSGSGVHTRERAKETKEEKKVAAKEGSRVAGAEDILMNR